MFHFKYGKLPPLGRFLDPAAGRMAEIVGKVALELDRYNRRIGLAYGAEKSWESLKDEKAREALEAYSNGANAFIS